MVRNEETKKGMPSKGHPLMVMMNKKLFSLCLLTSSSCHPKIFVKEFSYFLMSCH